MAMKFIGYMFIGLGIIGFVFATAVNAFTDKTASYDNVWSSIIAGCLMILASPE